MEKKKPRIKKIRLRFVDWKTYEKLDKLEKKLTKKRIQKNA